SLFSQLLPRFLFRLHPNGNCFNLLRLSPTLLHLCFPFRFPFGFLPSLSLVSLCRRFPFWSFLRQFWLFVFTFKAFPCTFIIRASFIIVFFNCSMPFLLSLFNALLLGLHLLLAFLRQKDVP